MNTEQYTRYTHEVGKKLRAALGNATQGLHIPQTMTFEEDAWRRLRPPGLIWASTQGRDVAGLFWDPDDTGKSEAQAHAVLHSAMLNYGPHLLAMADLGYFITEHSEHVLVVEQKEEYLQITCNDCDEGIQHREEVWDG